MSGMTEAIDRIAACAEQRNFGSYLRRWMIYSGYDPKQSTKDLGSEEIEGICPLGHYPKLSLEQIKEITKDFPFQLPVELYELYQRGNGCLPIGSGKKDWDSWDNYFPFPPDDEPFYSLEEAMKRYRDLTMFGERYGYDIDPRLFPISEFEELMHVVIGSEEQEETSPVFLLNTGCFIPQMEWLSLTNMMLAWAEVIERDLNKYDPADREEITAIWQRLGWRR